MNHPFSLGGSGEDCRHVTAAKRGTAEDFFYRRGAQCAPMPKPIRSAGYRSATHTGYSAQARHNSAAQVVSLEITDSTCECRRLVQFIFVGAVYHNALTNCATLLCRACGDPPICVAVMYLTLRTGYEKHGRKNPLPFPFSERSPLSGLRQAI